MGQNFRKTISGGRQELHLKPRKRGSMLAMMQLAKMGICVFSRAVINEGRRFPARSSGQQRVHVAKGKGTRPECPHTSQATSSKDEGPRARCLKPEDTDHKGVGCEAGRRSHKTEGP